MNRPVLVLGAEPRIAVTIARSLYRRGIPTDVAVLGSGEPELRSRVVRRFVRLPEASAPGNCLLQALHEEISAQGYDVLIPSSDTTLAACMDNYEALSRLLHVACPPPQITGAILDKQRTLEAAQRCGIRIPETYDLLNATELSPKRRALGFPLIAKPKEKRKTAAFKTRTFRTYEELEGAFAENAEFGAQNLIQEVCRGVGVGVEVLMHQGEAVALFQHRRLKELPATGGVSVLAIAEELDPRLVELSVRLLRELGWYGVAMVEFLYDPASGTATLMEVNGRYWGSIALATHAGVDFPGLHWQVIHGQKPDASGPYRRGLRARWFTGDLLRLYGLFVGPDQGAGVRGRRWKELAKFVVDSSPGTRDMLWSWSDPRPAISELLREVRHIAAKAVKSVLAGLLPLSLKKRIRTYQGLAPETPSWYLKRYMGRCLGMIRDGSRPLPREIRDIVCVCHGNIIRSPFAALRLSSLLGTGSNICVSSAGLYARPGKDADERARSAASAMGVSLEGHRAELLTREMVERAELILVMDFEGEAEMLRRFPRDGNKVFLLGALPSTDGYRSMEIEDPYEGDLTDVRHCYERLDDHLQALAKRLSTGT